jgi:benzoyl-CoA reductase subunit D
MITVGIDMGAKTVKAVVLKDGHEIGKSMVDMELDRYKSGKVGFQAALDDAGTSRNEVDKIIATGIGRKVVDWANKGSTVVACDARGIVALNPSVKMVIDVGANEARAIKCDETGKVIDFAVNEKCAAGSGAFVEAMARAMQVSLEEFAHPSFKSKKSIPINAQCAIFAESEVVSLVHDETDREDICRAVHDAIASRIASMARRVRIEEDVALIGGAAYNKGLLDSLEKELKVEFIVPEEPEYIGALGAALLARDL